ncbi:MAG: hypothetical protein JNK82_38690 [Myxococcaceae bacterium]|nr:hypothetical protein [Myxococcaceae bacterium]
MRVTLLLLLVACSGAVPSNDAGTAGGGATAGGAGAAGGTGAAGGSAPSDGGVCPAGTIVCDDFEGAAIDTAVWRIHLDRGTLTPDTTRAAKGTRSLHAVVQAGGGDAMVELKQRVPLDGQRLWGRMWMYVPQRVQPMLQNHTNLAVALGDNDLSTTAVYAAWVGGGKLGSLFYQVSPGIDVSGLGTMPPSTLPVDRWFCMEWDFNGVDRQIRVYLDGALIPMSELNGYHPPISALLRNGVQFALEEAWFDSVAWSRTRVGCD